MLIKCKCHEDNKIDRDTAFRVFYNGKNEYYCSESEYLEIKENNQNRTILLNSINEVFGYVITNTILYKELSEISKIYTNIKIYAYISENLEKLKQIMSKSFNNEYGKIRYFTTVLKNNLKDFIEIKETVKKTVDINVIAVKYEPKQRKKNLDEYLSELE